MVLGDQNAPVNSFQYTCGQTAISLLVKNDPLQIGLNLDPSKLHLGTCVASTTTDPKGYLAFNYKFTDCSFTVLTFGNNVKYSAVLIYNRSDTSINQYSSNSASNYPLEFTDSVTCILTRSLNPTVPPDVPVVAQLSGEGILEFSAQIMNDDFSRPSDHKDFALGSSISVELSVVTGQHQPLVIYVDKCTAATTESLKAATQTYSLIQNHGCFIDGKDASSAFQSRPSPGSIRLTIEALRFIDLDTDIFLHFQVMVWDPKLQNDATRKACSYRMDTNRWELLDNPALSSLCDCCESVCTSSLRKKRDINGVEEEEKGLVHTMVLGPFRVGGQDWNGNESKTVSSKPDFPIPPAVGALFLEVAVLLVLAVGIAVYSRRKANWQEIEADPLVATENSEPGMK
ncbi:zona pellucida sperm-binding protein 3-like [Pelobates fuscus]|uniref:zona pellucida sperm-binding protein 3-like n=1 Tax=Pelobates fuscus TaxID=191477 RepID=UPI002FE49AA9